MRTKTTTAKAAATKAVKTVETKAKEAEETVKKTVRKAPVRKSAVKETVYLQYLGKEIDKDAIIAQVRTVWTQELGNRESDLKSVTLYLKPEENAAYYVINDDVTGKISL